MDTVRVMMSKKLRQEQERKKLIGRREIWRKERRDRERKIGRASLNVCRNLKEESSMGAKEQ